MISKVASIVKSFSNSAFRSPVAWAKLTCGHDGKVEVVKPVYLCAECKLETTTPSKCPCGYRGGFISKTWPNPHEEADRLTKIGDAVECERCDWYQAALAKIRATKPGEMSHSRFRPNDSRGSTDGNYYVYYRDRTSPTGVDGYISIEATPESERVIAEVLGLSPLSPTEPR